MFLFGTTGTILPYIITLIALWSGVLLGYGRIFTFKELPHSDKEISVELNSSQTSQLAVYTDFVNKSQTSSETISQVYICVNRQPKIQVWLWYLHDFIDFGEFALNSTNFDISPTRGPPVC
jgi:hypothetical protein